MIYFIVIVRCWLCV